MKIQEMRNTVSVLGKEIGWSWPQFTLGVINKQNGINKNIQWTRFSNPESKFMKRLPIVSAVYLELIGRYSKEKALDMMEKAIVPIGLDESMTVFRSLYKTEENPMNTLLRYLDLVDEKGAGQFCNREYPEKTNIMCHRVVTKCPFHNFFLEAGTPELTRLFCEVDKIFYAKAFPELEFSRGDSWENTIAYGKDHCEFIFRSNKEQKIVFQVMPHK